MTDGYPKAADLYFEVKTWLGKGGAPAGVIETVVPKWFGYFQRILEKNDDGDSRTDEYTYGKVGGDTLQNDRF